MTPQIIPQNYKTTLGLKDTEIAIKKLKDYFEKDLSEKLNLIRVSAPLFVERNSGINDDLNGVERPVAFDIKEDNSTEVEIIHSLAKWKRIALSTYGFNIGEGLYTDMNAIRRDEDLDNLHSIYVDQWDWEKIISKEDRKKDTLKSIVTSIYEVFKNTEKYIHSEYEDIKPILPENIHFITSQELENLYPYLTPKEREDAICKDKGAVFLMEIGGSLTSGKPHDGRSPDYDDWTLNGDILFHYPILDRSMELSSMGIRVDEDALLKQLKVRGLEKRKDLNFHQMLLQGKLPYTIGGGIGQSRICMFFLRKAHIGEVQSSFWGEEILSLCNENNIQLL
ncbi:aspartate--ammonia ligase [Clostridium frigidicarnis]|uniref:Aspartate--ammonia ligase n=1 Tax=Clostridium frigidicarnis TaxID=84698 RepID=A0A1I0WGB2_9CLOT|nr:aspartate--ammonia ligase [Clostridium frigidicarnis]SFA87248.1 aspartate-ammonia ligase [Clostridium frigidicarnis]